MDVSEKKAFRKAMLAKRDGISSEDRKKADRLRNEQIINWDLYKEAELLLFYVSYRSEADTLLLLTEALEAGRSAAVPKVSGDNMTFYRIRSMSQLKEGYKGILEPDTMHAEPIVIAEEGRKNTILFVPGCAFDVMGGRMGYGGGFYDRFMEKYPDVLRVALAYEEQIVPEVPREVHDRPVDIIVTEKRLLYVSTDIER